MYDLHNSWTIPSVSKEREVIIFAKSRQNGWHKSPSGVARSPKVAIFVLTTTDIQTDRFTLACACTHGVINKDSIMSLFLRRMSESGGQESPSAVDLERRVRTLEHQVQRLTNTIVNSRASGAQSSQQGNGFWYVLTFTGWMMVPLVVVFMYHLKKSL